MFENQFFNKWLDNKSNEILSKVDKDITTTEEVLILSLRAQSTHFQQMEEEFSGEFKKIDESIERLASDLNKQLDKKFEKLNKVLMWGLGLVISVILAILAKLL